MTKKLKALSRPKTLRIYNAEDDAAANAAAEAAKAAAEAEASKAAEAEAAKAAEAEKALAEKQAAEKAAADKAAAEAEAKALKDAQEGLSDSEAKLVKEAMKRKKETAAARKEAEAAKARADALEKQFKDIDPEKARELLSAATTAEEEKLKAAGEFDKLKERMVEQHTASTTKLQEEIEGLRASKKSLEAKVDDLTIGTDFASSEFIAKETVLTPRIARREYGKHFDVSEDGTRLGFDKPRGDETRKPLTDASGNPLSFDAAMAEIISKDPDSAKLMRSTLKSGADSRPASPGKKGSEEEAKSNLDSITSGLAKLTGAKK